MPRPRSACLACATIKSACSKTQPCSRCARLSLTCSYQGALPLRGVPSRRQDGISHTVKRTRHKKSSNGCTGCITRRKKCDEVFPVCGDCHRLGLPCHPRAADHRTMHPALAAHKTLSVLDEATPPTDLEPPSPGQGNSANSSPESQSPASAGHFTKEYLEWIALLDESDEHGASPHRQLNDSSALAYWNSASGSPAPVHVDLVLANFRGVNQLAVSQWHPTERHLLNHYVQFVSRLLSVADDDHNPFLTELLPMAFDSLSVQHALLALSARHLCRVYPAFNDAMVKQQALALHFVKQDLQGPIASQSVLAATLLMCLFEICQGNSRKWILHIYGAKALIDSSSHPSTPSRFLTDLYDRLCCMAAITSENVPANVMDCNFSSSSESLCRKPIPSDLHALFGLAGDLYRCLNSINQLAIQRTTGYQSSESEMSLQARARSIEEYLHRWNYVEITDNWMLREAMSAAEAVRHGCIIWLRNVTKDRDSSQTAQWATVSEILSAVSRVRPGSPYDIQLLFPLFMAGAFAVLKSERLRIEYRLNLMESTLGMGNVACTRKMLDSIWKCMNDCRNIVVWEEIFKSEYGGTVLM